MYILQSFCFPFALSCSRQMFEKCKVKSRFSLISYNRTHDNENGQNYCAQDLYWWLVLSNLKIKYAEVVKKKSFKLEKILNLLNYEKKIVDHQKI